MALKNEGNERAILAYEKYKNAIVEYIGKYYFELQGQVDAIVFTAGVLENNVNLREDIVNDMAHVLNIRLNKEVNDNLGYGHELKEGLITTLDSKLGIYVIPTNEEIMILRDTYHIINHK